MDLCDFETEKKYIHLLKYFQRIIVEQGHLQRKYHICMYMKYYGSRDWHL